MALTEQQIPIYVINLSSSPDRWINASEQMDKLGLVCIRFDAVDGTKFTDEDVNSACDMERSIRWTYDLTRPEIGCYLSHIHLWEKIADSDDQGAFIFEDDFIVKDDLPAVLNDLSALSFFHPTIVKLYDQYPPTRFIDCGFLTENHKLTIPRHVPLCTVAYYINKSAAERLAQMKGKFFRPIDEDLRLRWETQVDVFLISPTPIMSKTAYTESSIETQRFIRNQKYTKTLSSRIRKFFGRDLYYRIGNRLFNTLPRSRRMDYKRNHE